MTESIMSGVRGPVWTSADPEYYDEVTGFNAAVEQRPDLVVGATCTADVVAAMAHARARGHSVSVQATGHGAGRPVTGGLLVTTRRMADLELDPGTARVRVGAGVRWCDVLAAAAPHGLAPLNGSSLTVGVVGYLLGGGLGPMARTFGFAADHVISLELVTPDGKVHQVDADSEPELFWGLRGGKCELGIVTSIEFDLMPVPTVYGGAVYFPGDSAPAVLSAWRDWTRDLPEEVTTSIALLRLPDIDEVPEPLRGRLTVHLRYVHVGDPEAGARLVAPMRASACPLVDMVDVMPYSAIGMVHNDPEGPLPAWDRSALLTELPDAALDALLATAGPGVEVPLILAELRLLGGAVARDPEPANAVGGRDAAYGAYVVGPLPPPLAQLTPAAGLAVLAALAPWCTDATMINFQGSRADAADVRRAWSPQTRARLDRLHQVHDPDGVCRFALPTRS